jgi:glycosyltransferase involved in cell wall biosynthesis
MKGGVEALRRQVIRRRPSTAAAVPSPALVPDATAAGRATAASACPVSPAKPLRVCHLVSGDLWAGAEVQLATAAAYLVQRPDVMLSAVLLNHGRLEQELRALGVQVNIIEEHRHGPLGIVSSVHRLLRDGRVDVLHTHRYKETILGTFAAKLARVPHLVRTVHGLNEQMRGWQRLKLGAYQVAEQAMLQLFSDRVVAVSEDIGRSLEDRGYRAAAIEHVHNGIDLRKVQAARCREEVRRELGIDRHALLVGTVGRLAPVKGHKHFLQAAAVVLQSRPDARFLIVGDGPLRAELTAAAAQIGSRGECLITGERADTYDLVTAMDVFVLPSLHEGIPMAVLEAMALGTPVIATAVGGVPEVVIDGVTGLLVPSRDQRRLASACLQIAADRQLSRKLAGAARRAIEEDFSSEKNGAALVDLYQRLVRGAPDALCAVGPLVESRSHAHAGSRLR